MFRVSEEINAGFDSWVCTDYTSRSKFQKKTLNYEKVLKIKLKQNKNLTSIN